MTRRAAAGDAPSAADAAAQALKARKPSSFTLPFTSRSPPRRSPMLDSTRAAGQVRPLRLSMFSRGGGAGRAPSSPPLAFDNPLLGAGTGGGGGAHGRGRDSGSSLQLLPLAPHGRGADPRASGAPPLQARTHGSHAAAAAAAAAEPRKSAGAAPDDAAVGRMLSAYNSKPLPSAAPVADTPPVARAAAAIEASGKGGFARAFARAVPARGSITASDSQQTPFRGGVVRQPRRKSSRPSTLALSSHLLAEAAQGEADSPPVGGTVFAAIMPRHPRPRAILTSTVDEPKAASASSDGSARLDAAALDLLPWKTNPLAQQAHAVGAPAARAGTSSSCGSSSSRVLPLPWMADLRPWRKNPLQEASAGVDRVASAELRPWRRNPLFSEEPRIGTP